MTDPDVPSHGTVPPGADPVGDPRLEDLLRGTAATPPEELMSLAALLDALRAPGTPDELGGIDAAASSFVRARSEVLAGDLAPVTPLLARRNGRRAAVAVAGATAAVLLLGTAAAAATGTLPGPLKTVFGLSDSDSASAVADAVSSSSGAASSRTASPGTSAAEGPDASPSSPALPGLCVALRAQGLATTSVAYRNLADAAAKEGKTVAAYCDLHAPAKPRPSTAASGKPSTPGKPSTAPTKKPSTAGKPSTKPTQAARPSSPTKPTNASSGKPTGVGKPSSST